MTRNGPDYSIIIPTYQRRGQLTRCLAAIEKLEFPRERFELLVVDDGSPAPPDDVVRALDGSVHSRLVRARHRGPAAARNTGARLARGRYLVFTDDDCAPHRDWLSAIDRWISTSATPLILGGHTVNVLADDVYAIASQGIVDFLYEYYGRRPAERGFFTTNNLAVPRAEFMAMGGFDEGFRLAAAEDRDLCERWRRAGRDLQFAPDVVVDHAHALTFARFNRQHFNYGRGAFDLHRSRARRGQGALTIEPVRFYSELITYPLRQSGGWRGVELATLHFWSQVAYAAGYFFERIRRGWAIDSTAQAEASAYHDAADEPSLEATADQSSLNGAA
jgi:glycosyltransferase involved in cell wall biosynthesis